MRLEINSYQSTDRGPTKCFPEPLSPVLDSVVILNPLSCFQVIVKDQGRRTLTQVTRGGTTGESQFKVRAEGVYQQDAWDPVHT